MRIAVAGGTGTVGAHVVDVARERGLDAVVLARRAGVDVVTGSGLDQALSGVDVVVDTTSVSTLDRDEAVTFFSAASRSLLAAGERAGVGHHVALSIVGIDGSASGYYAGKAAQERLVAAGSVPWTILRATQFHEFAAQMFVRAKVGPIHLAPRMRTQPIAAREVATRLVDLAVAPPAGRANDLGGPREENLVEMVRAYARAVGHRGWIPGIPLPGAAGREQRDGSLLPGPGADRGRQTFDEWLASLP